MTSPVSCSIISHSNSSGAMVPQNAQMPPIFIDIVELLETETPEVAQQALERFSRMPKTAKNAIYRKLQLLKPFANDDPGCAELVFYDATFTQKAQAIRDYLNDLQKEEKMRQDMKETQNSGD
jgi:hypothetical protein